VTTGGGEGTVEGGFGTQVFAGSRARVFRDGDVRPRASEGLGCAGANACCRARRSGCGGVGRLRTQLAEADEERGAGGEEDEAARFGDGGDGGIRGIGIAAEFLGVVVSEGVVAGGIREGEVVGKGSCSPRGVDDGVVTDHHNSAIIVGGGVGLALGKVGRPGEEEHREVEAGRVGEAVQVGDRAEHVAGAEEAADSVGAATEGDVAGGERGALRATVGYSWRGRVRGVLVGHVAVGDAADGVGSGGRGKKADGKAGKGRAEEFQEMDLSDLDVVVQDPL